MSYDKKIVIKNTYDKKFYTYEKKVPITSGAIHKLFFHYIQEANVP